ncbi:MAG: transposase [Marinilabiliales bacterium]|nr:transposase [Marinilabiliales bacterium]
MKSFFPDHWSEEEINALFQSDEQCLAFLADLKWQEGFVCRKCGHTNFCPGKTPHSRRCTKCKSEESATAGTLFHNCKFPVSKAFYIAFNVCRGNQDISSYELARRLALRQMTCWQFKSRIKTALASMEELSDSEKENATKLFIP